MSFMRRLSFRAKSQFKNSLNEFKNKETPSVMECKPNGDIDCEHQPRALTQVTAATSSENGEFRQSTNEQCTVSQVSQHADNNEKLENSLKEISSLNDTGDYAVTERRDLVKSQSECTPDKGKEPDTSLWTQKGSNIFKHVSFPIPDGLVMDPLAPTAIAVSNEFMERIGSGLTLLRDHGKKVQKYVLKNSRFDILRKSWNSLVNIVLIEAKNLPDIPANGSNGLYCKFKLGGESHKSKSVTLKSKPTWREQFNLYMYDVKYLEVTVWHKGKQKNFMGRGLIDLSKLEREKTHDIWLDLECGFGCLHLLVTLSGSMRRTDNIPTTNGVHLRTLPQDEFTWYRFDNWDQVGRLCVTVHSAKGLSALGLSGKADAYCVLELDNSRVQTHTVRDTSEPHWNNTYYFTVNDITSTLDITVYDESILNSMKGETLGKLSIPLLRINNNELKWYALKDRSKKGSAKGNCPRILLQMSVVWNPIKASLRVLSPKETKYMQKPPKFNIPLIYSNLEFIKDIFTAIHTGNEHFKLIFEWDNRERSAVALIVWLIFWYYFQLWMAPLLLLLPFLYHWFGQRYYGKNNVWASTSHLSEDDILSEEDLETFKDDKTVKTRLYGLQDLTFTIKNSIDYIVSVIERIHNLTNFTVPYLSYLAMTLLVLTSVILYFIPVNYLFMALGIYKFTRKLLNPERIPNNDVLDFISRVPDNEILKQWRELKVPEPNLSRSGSAKRKGQIES